MILAGDVGGTKCNLAVFDDRKGTLQPIFQRLLPSRNYPDFESVIRDFLTQASPALAEIAGKITAAGFGVAGPVVDGRVRATNLPWILDAAALARKFAIEDVVLLNDLEASGYGLESLRPHDLFTLNPCTPVPGANKALIAAGTGLGEAILFWDGSRYIVSASEGGHCDFAPRTDTEIELLRFLQKRGVYLEYETILSGRGFRLLHEFVAPDVKHASFDTKGADPAPEIAQAGLAGTCPHCVKVLELFVAIYGAEAGNLALKSLPRSGMYVAGGIAVKILEKMKDGTFLRSFREKAILGNLLAQIPIYVVLNQHLPVLGAAARAAMLVGEPSAGAEREARSDELRGWGPAALI